MNSSSGRKREEQEGKPMMPSRQFDNMFDSFRRDVPVRNEREFNLLNSVPPLHILHCRE